MKQSISSLSHWLFLAVALAAGAASAASPSIYGESPMVKVRPSTTPHADAGVNLTGARNEFVSFQVVVNGADTGATSVRAAFPGLTGPGNIDGTDVTLYREGFLNITTSSGMPGGATGRWPDALIPDTDEIAGEKRSAFPFNVPAGESRAVWVDVHIPADARPGQYTGQVAVTGSGLSASVSVTLNVVDVLLPSTPSLATAFLLYEPLLCQAHLGNPTWCGGDPNGAALVARYERMALEHRITLSNPFHAQPSGDWSGFDATYSPFLDGTAPSRLAGAKMTSAQYPGNSDAVSYAAFTAHFKDKGWLDRAYDYTIDEPSTDAQFNQAAQRASLVHKNAPGLRTLMTLTVQTAQSRGLLSAVDLIVPVAEMMDGTEAPYVGDQRPQYEQFLQDPGKKLWMYQSCLSQGCTPQMVPPENVPGAGWPSYMVDVSAAKNRAMQWLDFRERATGELYYQTMMALPSAWNDQFQFNGNGDGTLFYPGTPAMIGGATDVPVASIRLKLIRMGVQDYEWLKLVSDAGDPTFARQIVQSVLPSSHQAPDDGAVFETARLQLISRLTQLRQPAGGTPGVGDGTNGGSTNGTGVGTPAPGGSTQTPDDTPPVGSASTPRIPLSPAGDSGMKTSGCGAAPGSLGLSPLWFLMMVALWGRRALFALLRSMAATFARARTPPRKP